MKMSLSCYFFDLIVNKAEIYKIPKWTQFSHEMLKIASVSGAPPQTPLGELTTLPIPPSREELLCLGTRNLTYSRVLISTPASRSQVFPSRLTGPAQFCGADELWILLYTLYSPNLCFRAFCYFMNPASNKNLIHLLFFDLIAKIYEINICKNLLHFGIKC